MNSITVFVFRVLLVLGGMVFIYLIGKPMSDTIRYRFNGNVVVGRVIGFRGSGSSKTIFEENTGKKGVKNKARRPVYKYPVANGSLDSLEGFAGSTVLIPWLNFKLNEKVTIVTDSSNPSDSHLFSVGVLFTDLLLIFLGLFMIKLGFTRSKT